MPIDYNSMYNRDFVLKLSDVKAWINVPTKIADMMTGLKGGNASIGYELLQSSGRFPYYRISVGNADGFEGMIVWALNSVYTMFCRIA